VTVAVVALAIALLAALGGLTWSIHRISQLGDQLRGAERATTELEATISQQALDAERRRTAALEEIIADADAPPPNADLPAADVTARLRRRREAHAAAGSGGEVPAEPAAGLPLRSSPGGSVPP
jgi:hypothetical protein